MAVSAVAFEVELVWDPNTEPDLAGYKLYFGTASGQYGTPVNVGMIQPSADGFVHYITAQNFTFGTTYYFAITAYDNETPVLESGHSNEVFTNGASNIGPRNPTGAGIYRVINTSQ